MRAIIAAILPCGGVGVAVAVAVIKADKPKAMNADFNFDILLGCNFSNGEIRIISCLIKVNYQQLNNYKTIRLPSLADRFAASSICITIKLYFSDAWSSVAGILF